MVSTAFFLETAAKTTVRNSLADWRHHFVILLLKTTGWFPDNALAEWEKRLNTLKICPALQHNSSIQMTKK
jgi:hypothetical protein